MLSFAMLSLQNDCHPHLLNLDGICNFRKLLTSRI